MIPSANCACDGFDQLIVPRLASSAQVPPLVAPELPDPPPPAAHVTPTLAQAPPPPVTTAEGRVR